VKWIQDRREALVSDNQERQQTVKARLGFDDEGRFAAISFDAIADIGAFPTNVGAGPPWVAMMMVEGQYRFPLAATSSTVVVTNKTPIGAQRGFGMPVANWVLERLVDEAARELGLDPIEVRLRNLIGEDEFPYTIRTGLTYDSGRYAHALERAVEIARATPTPDDGRRRGIGIGSFVEFTGLGPVALLEEANFNLSGYETATMRMETDGSLTVASGVMAMGQGIETTLAQIAADAVGVPFESIKVVLGDTSSTPYSSTGSIASRSIPVGGSAMQKAGERLRKKIVEYAAHQLEAAEEDLEIEDGAVRVRGVPDAAISLAELADKSSKGWGLPDGMEPKLEVEEIFDPPGITYGFATTVAGVAVDLETGDVEVESFVAVHDCGTVINPMIVDGQVHGALANGIGTALLEAFDYDEYGQPRATTFMDYLLPSSAEVPEIIVEHTETPSPLTPGGVKGVGEGGTVGAPAAVGNAVADAVPEIAAKITRTPLSQSRLWTLIQETELGQR
jgi:aerobic carbon-monoxide dehydrogenase large subunit